MGFYRSFAEKALEIAERAVSGANPKPIVSFNGSGLTKPFELYVSTSIENAEFSDRVTSHMGATGARGLYRVEFSVPMRAWAVRASEEDASWVVYEWAFAVQRELALDKTMGGLAVHAEPYMKTLQKGRTDNNRHAAQLDFGIKVRAEIDPARS